MISKLYQIGCVKGCDKSPNAIIQATIISKLLNSTPTKTNCPGESSIRQWTSRPFLWEKTHHFKVSDSFRESKRMHVHLRDQKIPRNERSGSSTPSISHRGCVIRWIMMDRHCLWWPSFGIMESIQIYPNQPLPYWKIGTWQIDWNNSCYDTLSEQWPRIEHASSLRLAFFFFSQGSTSNETAAFGKSWDGGFWPQLSFSRRDGKRLLERRIR